MTFRFLLLARGLARSPVAPFGLVALIGALSLVAAQPTKPATKVSAPPVAKPPVARSALDKLPPIETFTLGNGLTVAVLSIDTVPAVSVQLWYRAGSKDEPRDRRGLAQVAARSMWKGSHRVRPDAHIQLIGAVGGRVNGGTDEDATHLGDSVPSAYLDFAIELEAERMRGLQLREVAVKSEREQLITELKQEDSSPIARGLRRLLELSFTKHPYAWPSGGVLGDLQAVTAGDVQRFYDTYYVPNNALLIVVGDASIDTVKASVNKHFGSFAAAPIVRTTTPDSEPAITAQRRETAKPGQLGLVMIGFGVPAAVSKDWAALQVAATLLGTGDGSRIKQRLRAGGKEIGLDGGVSAQPREHPSLFIALAAYRDGGGDAVEAALFDEINKLALRGPGKEELRIAKTQLQARAAFALEGSDGIASQLGRSWILSGDVKAFAGEIDRIEAVKIEDVKRVLSTYLRPERATILVIPPTAKTAKP
jgi:zinc protease